MPSISRKEIEQSLRIYFSAKFGGTVEAMYVAEGAKYYIYGSRLPRHPELTTQYVDGWSLTQFIPAADALLIARSQREPHLKDMKVRFTTNGANRFAMIETVTTNSSFYVSEGREPSASFIADAADLRQKAQRYIKMAEQLELAALIV